MKQDELMHFGVLGMRWGHHKTDSEKHRIKEQKKIDRNDNRNAQWATHYLQKSKSQNVSKQYYEQKAKKYQEKTLLDGKDYTSKYNKMSAKALKWEDKYIDSLAKSQKYVDKMSSAVLVKGVPQVYMYDTGDYMGFGTYKDDIIVSDKTAKHMIGKRHLYQYDSMHELKKSQ